jgi:hypothetical protein
VKTILQIIEEAGGLPKAECISIDNEPWMRLVIEVLPERGPDGHVVVSVAHYGEQNSDAMRDPEMLFERELSPRNSVLRRNFFGVVHHDHLDGDPPRFQLEPQFLLQDLENRARGHVDDALRRRSGAIAAAGDR